VDLESDVCSLVTVLNVAAVVVELGLGKLDISGNGGSFIAVFRVTKGGLIVRTEI